MRTGFRQACLSELSSSIMANQELRTGHVPLFNFGIVWLYVSFAAQQLAQSKTSMLKFLVVCVEDSPITERRCAEHFAKKDNLRIINITITRYFLRHNFVSLFCHVSGLMLMSV